MKYSTTKNGNLNRENAINQFILGDPLFGQTKILVNIKYGLKTLWWVGYLGRLLFARLSQRHFNQTNYAEWFPLLFTGFAFTFIKSYIYMYYMSCFPFSSRIVKWAASSTMRISKNHPSGQWVSSRISRPRAPVPCWNRWLPNTSQRSLSTWSCVFGSQAQSRMEMMRETPMVISCRCFNWTSAWVKHGVPHGYRNWSCSIIYLAGLLLSHNGAPSDTNRSQMGLSENRLPQTWWLSTSSFCQNCHYFGVHPVFRCTMIHPNVFQLLKHVRFAGHSHSVGPRLEHWRWPSHEEKATWPKASKPAAGLSSSDKGQLTGLPRELCVQGLPVFFAF